jgi:hypothetical protein
LMTRAKTGRRMKMSVNFMAHNVPDQELPGVGASVKSGARVLSGTTD